MPKDVSATLASAPDEMFDGWVKAVLGFDISNRAGTAASDEEAGGSDLPSLKRMLTLARQGPVRAAFALGSDGQAMVALDRRKPGRALGKALQKNAPEAKVLRFGQVAIDPYEPRLACFTVNKTASGMARKLVKALKGTGVSKVRIVLEDGTPDDAAEEDELEDGGSGGAAPSAETMSSELATLLREKLADGSDPAELARAGNAIAGSLKQGDLVGARTAMAALRGNAEAAGGAPGNSDELDGSGTVPTHNSIAATPSEAPGPGVPGGAPGGGGPQPAKILTYKVLVPKDYTTLEQMFRLFERTVYGKELNLTWHCNDFCDMSKNAGRVIEFNVPASDVDAGTDPAVKQATDTAKAAFDALQGQDKQAVAAEADRRYRAASGTQAGQAKTGGEKRMHDQALAGVMQDREQLQHLPLEIQKFLFGEGGIPLRPKDYAQLLRIVDKLKQFKPEDFATYKQMPLRPNTDLKLFEDSVDLFLAHKPAPSAAPDPKAAQDVEDAVNEAWTGFDKVDVANMSESERYELARQKADEVTGVRLKYAAEHPGETLKQFAHSANPLNAPEGVGAAWDDLKEAADGDANGFARFAAGAGAGAKLSGVALTIVGVLYVASWATGIGEVATLAAGAGYLLGATLTLSLAESELRIKAASQAKTPEEFRRNVDDAAAAQTTIALCLAGMALTAAVFFGAKALFPETVAKIQASIKGFREQLKDKVGLARLKPSILKEMAARKAELSAAATKAKGLAAAAAKEIQSMTAEQFAAKLKTDKGFLNNASVAGADKLDFAELLKTDAGRMAIEGYRQRVVQALNSDVAAAIDARAADHAASIDDFLREVEKAAAPDDLLKAADALDVATGQEHGEALLRAEHEKLVGKLLEEGYRDNLATEKGKVDPDLRAEADTVLQALREGEVSGTPRRPNLKGGEPDHDFLLEEKGKPTRYAEVKTPRDPIKVRRSLEKQSKDIGDKIKLYPKADNLDIILDLKYLTVTADKAAFLKLLEAQGVDLSKLKILNK